MILVLAHSPAMAEEWCRGRGLVPGDAGVRVLTRGAVKGRMLSDGDEVHFVGNPHEVAADLTHWFQVLVPMGCRTITVHLRGGS